MYHHTQTSKEYYVFCLNNSIGYFHFSSTTNIFKSVALKLVNNHYEFAQDNPPLIIELHKYMFFLLKHLTKYMPQITLQNNNILA